MSGEPTVVFAPTPATRALVGALGTALATPGLRAVLIGGLGVACRLAEVHRVTGDVDLVTGEGDEPPAATLVRAGIATADTSFEGRVFVNGTKLELIETSPLTEPLAVDADDDRLFVLSHRWALETGTACRLMVEAAAPTTVDVATPAALVATKLHALGGRRREERKRASDAYDIFRLLAAWDTEGVVAASLLSAPADLANLVASAVRAAFLDDASRTMNRIHAFGDADWNVTADDLAAVAEPFVRQLEEAS